MHVVPDDVFRGAADLGVESNVSQLSQDLLVVDVEFLVFEVPDEHRLVFILV